MPSTGHELGFLGLAAFMGSRPRLAQEAHLWVHLGASIGAAVEPRMRLAASDRTLATNAAGVIGRAGEQLPDIVPPESVPMGEARDVHLQGGRYLSLAGFHGLFHTEADRWPDAVEADSLAGHAEALAEIVLTHSI